MEIRKPVLAFLSIILLIASCTKRQMGESSPVPYTEQHRPQFHFSPQAHWMNDPNGLVFHRGEYHLFYQFYPDSNVWGPMHWGHAITRDLIHWEHLPIALYPDSLGLIFSGSAVIDHQNTTGFGSSENPPMVAIFTYHLVEGEKAGRNNYQTQGIAYSLDNGRTWEKYKENPVLANPGKRDFRDPKVFWYEPEKKWIMILAVYDHVELYGSPDLKTWYRLSEFGINEGSHGGVWECPDLFPLQIEGELETKWVMLVSLNAGSPNGGSGTQYFVGDFDGTRFINGNPSDHIQWIDYGRDNYAGVTWSNIPAEDGRRLFLGWMSNWDYAQVVPTYMWRSAMTLPRELVLVNTPNGIRLASRLVKEVDLLVGQTKVAEAQHIEGELMLDSTITRSGLFELEIDLDSTSAKNISVELSNLIGEKLSITYSIEENSILVDRTACGKNDFSPKFAGVHKGPRVLTSYPSTLRLIVDQSSVEIFVDDGLLTMTEIFFPSEVFSNVKIISEDVKVTKVTVTELNRIW